MNRTMLKSKIHRARSEAELAGNTPTVVHVGRDNAIVRVDEAAAEVVA